MSFLPNFFIVDGVLTAPYTEHYTKPTVPATGFATIPIIPEAKPLAAPFTPSLRAPLTGSVTIPVTPSYTPLAIA